MTQVSPSHVPLHVAATHLPGAPLELLDELDELVPPLLLELLLVLPPSAGVRLASPASLCTNVGSAIHPSRDVMSATASPNLRIPAIVSRIGVAIVLLRKPCAFRLFSRSRRWR